MIELRFRHRKLLNEAAWVFAGQLTSAIGTLVGLRLVTEAVPPQVYGAAVLAIGIITLAQGAAVGPLMQAVLRFHLEPTSGAAGLGLRRVVVSALRQPVMVMCFALLLIIGAWALGAGEEYLLGPLCSILFLVEVVRSVEVTFLNAARKQRTMALLVTVDAWLRPIAAVSVCLAYRGPMLPR